MENLRMILQTNNNFSLHFSVNKRTKKYQVGLCLTDLDSILGNTWTNIDSMTDDNIYFEDSPASSFLFKNLLKNEQCRSYYQEILKKLIEDIAEPSKAQREIENLWSRGTQQSVQRKVPDMINPVYPFEKEVVENHIIHQLPVADWGERGEGFFSVSPSIFLKKQKENIQAQLKKRAPL